MISTLACGDMSLLFVLVAIPFLVTVAGGMALAFSIAHHRFSPWLFCLGAAETLAGLVMLMLNAELFSFTIGIWGPWWSLPLGIATMWVNVQRSRRNQTASSVEMS